LACCTSSVFSFRLIHLDVRHLFSLGRFECDKFYRISVSTSRSHTCIAATDAKWILLFEVRKWLYFLIILWIYCNCQQASPPYETLRLCILVVSDTATLQLYWGHGKSSMDCGDDSARGISLPAYRRIPLQPPLTYVKRPNHTLPAFVLTHRLDDGKGA
jgi:hypothetical protein